MVGEIATTDRARSEESRVEENYDASTRSDQKPEVFLSSKDIIPTPPSQAYSVFSEKEKRIAVFLITFAATFSPLSSFIFFPAISALSESLKISVEKVNLTVTSYMVVAGIAPAIIGDMADMTGRRIVYLITILVYIVANIGLAVQNSWIALFLLRMLQSAGGAATIAMGYGVISDIASPSERGGYVGVVLLGPNFATAIGPILGGVLVQAPGWRWIFWLPAIASGICLLCIALFLPETSRFIVGNGSKQVSAIHRPLVYFYKSKKLPNASASDNDQISRRKFRFPNPLATLKILAARDSLLITAIYGIYYMNFSCLQGSLSTLFIQIYKISELKAGLIYLPFGVGSCVGAYCSGTIMNRDYRITARTHQFVIDTVHGDDLSVFPIEKARFRSIWYSICATGLCTAGYGWALHFQVHMAIPLVLQFIIGFAIAVTFNVSGPREAPIYYDNVFDLVTLKSELTLLGQCCGTLLTDLNPKSPAAAQAANNIVRCSLAGAGLAFLQACLDSMGTGWTFTLFGGLCMTCIGFAWLEWKYGGVWRQ